ncbi:MAG: beta-lactamase family protein, partial [Bradyrhizobium sp.]|nr:beta-lactamase family protein [Bradyrhizobium sp.]
MTRTAVPPIALFFLLAAVASALAESAPFGPPPGVQIAVEKLAPIEPFVNGEIAAGKIPGAIVLVQQHGKPVYLKWFGTRDPDKGTPMTQDAIFPIHSATKTITSIAAMMLIDRGKIALDDPVSKYIPSFAGMKVGFERKDESGKTALDLLPLRRPITVEDLLLHTSGITYGFYGDGLVKAAYEGI